MDKNVIEFPNNTTPSEALVKILTELIDGYQLSYEREEFIKDDLVSQLKTIQQMQEEIDELREEISYLK